MYYGNYVTATDVITAIAVVVIPLFILCLIGLITSIVLTPSPYKIQEQEIQRLRQQKRQQKKDQHLKQIKTYIWEQYTTEKQTISSWLDDMFECHKNDSKDSFVYQYNNVNRLVDEKITFVPLKFMLSNNQLPTNHNRFLQKIHIPHNTKNKNKTLLVYNELDNIKIISYPGNNIKSFVDVYNYIKIHQNSLMENSNMLDYYLDILFKKWETNKPLEEIQHILIWYEKTLMLTPKSLYTHYNCWKQQQEIITQLKQFVIEWEKLICDH